MGEKIRVINSINGFLDIELNKATFSGGPRYIHIQNPKIRFCITESEFLQMATTILKGEKILKHNKHLEQ